MNILLITRDIKHGEGHHVLNLLKFFKDSPTIEHIHIISPGEFAIDSNKISYHKFEPFGKNFITKQPHSAIKAPYLIKKVLAKNDIDLIHAHYPFIIRRINKPVISTFHFYNYSRLNPDHFGIPELVLTDPFHFLYQYFDNISVRRSEKVVLVSKDVQEILIKKHPKQSDKFVYVPNFVDTDLFVPSFVSPDSFNKGNEFNIMFVGRLDRSKGFDRLVKAMNLLRHEGLPIRLNVVGQGPLAHLSKDHPNINMLGRVENAMLSDVYAKNHCFILPSLYENCPISIIEAMSCGLPVIASDVGNVRYMIPIVNGYF